MTGPDHYAEAERLVASYLESLERAKSEMLASGSTTTLAPTLTILDLHLKLAQVHATLAVAWGLDEDDPR